MTYKKGCIFSNQVCYGKVIQLPTNAYQTITDEFKITFLRDPKL